MRTVARGLERLLETLTIALVCSLALVVVVAVVYRKMGASLSWYDEVASVQLAWITYYGSALAALKRKHIGFDGFLLAMPPAWRAAGIVVAEGLSIGFFVLMTWAGLEVLAVLEGMTLISLPFVPISLTQSVIPIGGALFIVCSLLSLPAYWRATMAGVSLEHADLEEAA